MSIFRKSGPRAKYIDFTESSRKALIYSFIGPKSGEDKNLSSTKATVAYMSKSDTGTAFSPWIEQWERSLLEVAAESFRNNIPRRACHSYLPALSHQTYCKAWN